MGVRMSSGLGSNAPALGELLLDPMIHCVEVASLSRAKRVKRDVDAVLTVEDPGIHPNRSLRFHSAPHPPHLILRFEDADVDDGRVWVAAEADVMSALAFARANAGDGTSRLLVHCQYGVGRSAALGLAIVADRLGAGREDEAVAVLMALRPEATPNLVVIGLADRILGRGGRLAAALEARERADEAMSDRRRSRAICFRDHRYRYADRPSESASSGPVSFVSGRSGEVR